MCVCVFSNAGGRWHLGVAHGERVTHLSCPLRGNIYITQLHSNPLMWTTRLQHTHKHIHGFAEMRVESQ